MELSQEETALALTALHLWLRKLATEADDLYRRDVDAGRATLQVVDKVEQLIKKLQH